MQRFSDIDNNWQTSYDDLYEAAHEKYEYFWKQDDIYSQWHFSVFFCEELKFTCAGQYMMYQKAILFGDNKIANKILKEKDPRRIESLGNNVHGFTDDVWNANCLHIVKNGNIAKFCQNKHLKEQLFATYPKILVEANPCDNVLGIGLEEDDERAWDESTWEGKNYLGYIITEVRDELMADAGIIEKRDRKICLPTLLKQMVGSYAEKADTKAMEMNDQAKERESRTKNDKQSDEANKKIEDKTFCGIDQNWQTSYDDMYEAAHEKYEYFWKRRDIYSQWHFSVFFCEELKFTCAEQYMMYNKAIMFGDCKIANKIIKEKDPRKIKSLGRNVHGFTDAVWNDNCLHIVKNGNIAKFSQNKHLKEQLFATYPKILVEANPFDKIWGIGLDEDDERAWDESTWEGKNCLGYIITEVRDELMADAGIIEKKDKKVYLPTLMDQTETNKETISIAEGTEDDGTPVKQPESLPWWLQWLNFFNTPP